MATALRKSKALRAALVVSSFLAASGPLAAADAPVSTTAKDNSPREALRTELFKGQEQTSSCKLIKMDPRGHSGLEPALDTVITKLLHGIKAKDDLALQPLFHPRLNIGLAALKEVLAKLDLVYGSPFDVSIYRLWALNSPDGSPSALSCPDEQSLKVYPHYGYPLQFALWLQVMGQKEVGRIYVSLVPVGDQWYVGTFHTQQWTHDAKDPPAWIAEANREAGLGHKESAYIKYDLAAKLLDGGGFVDLALRDDVIKARDAQMSKDAWEDSMRKTIAPDELVYAASIFVEGGAGIVLRTRIQAEISLDEIKKRCSRIISVVSKQPWGSSLAGVKCAFLLPNEKGQQDGLVGAIFMPMDGPGK